MGDKGGLDWIGRKMGWGKFNYGVRYEKRVYFNEKIRKNYTGEKKVIQFNQIKILHTRAIKDFASVYYCGAGTEMIQLL